MEFQVKLLCIFYEWNYFLQYSRCCKCIFWGPILSSLVKGVVLSHCGVVYEVRGCTNTMFRLVCVCQSIVRCKHCNVVTSDVAISVDHGTWHGRPIRVEYGERAVRAACAVTPCLPSCVVEQNFMFGMPAGSLRCYSLYLVAAAKKVWRHSKWKSTCEWSIEVVCYFRSFWVECLTESERRTVLHFQGRF